MPKIDFQYKRIAVDESKYGKGFDINSLSKKDFESFNSFALGLGDISSEGKYIQALAAFYDLEGFTAFSNQVDSHLVIPEFLKNYIDWLFRTLADEFKEGETEGRIRTWGSLPFYVKFLGDGILLLWDTSFSGGAQGVRNIILNLHITLQRYAVEFLPQIKKHVSHAPNRLRCGIARGQIISIGDGNDYVGSCINTASRLQKLSRLSFAISRRGIDLSPVAKEMRWKGLVLKKVKLRGIGSEELVYIYKHEFDKLPKSESRLFREP